MLVERRHLLALMNDKTYIAGYPKFRWARAYATKLVARLLSEIRKSDCVEFSVQCLDELRIRDLTKCLSVSVDLASGSGCLLDEVKYLWWEGDQAPIV